MQKDFIINFLGIKDKCIELWDFKEKDQKFYIWVQTKQCLQVCPSCSTKTKRVHGYRNQKVQGRLIEDKPVIIHVKKRRYYCPGCSRTFNEKLSFLQPYQRHTASLEQQAMTYVAEHSFTATGKMVGMSANRVTRLFDKREMEAPKVLPECIAIDEFKGDAGKEKFQTIIVDVKNKRILDILPNRRNETIQNYFRERDAANVQVVVMDLSSNFRSAATKIIGIPLIVADRFHYMRQAYWALDKVRRESQKEMNQKDRIRSKRNKELLWKSPRKLTDLQKEKVKEILRDQPELEEAYALKNSLDEWFKTSDETTAKEGLEAWFQLVENSNIEAFKSVVKTYKRWKKEILNSFVYPYSNGYIEGVNNTTKVIKRNSYGIRNFERLRKKILWRQHIRTVSA